MIFKDMRSQELRIGNLVNLMVNHEDFETIRVDVTDLINIHNGGVYEPIPVTEKWFEKFGFYRDGEYWCKGINDYKYCFKYRDWAENWAFYQEFTDSPDDRDDGVKYPISFDIKYVHQLQNLWYALLFEELTIKE